jgi:hypothetical protein
MQRTLNQFRTPKPIVTPSVQDLKINKPISIEATLNQNEQTAAATAASDNSKQTEKPIVAKKRGTRKQQKKVLENLIEEALKLKPFLESSVSKSVLANSNNALTMTEILDRIKKEKTEQDISIEKLRKNNNANKQEEEPVVSDITNFIDLQNNQRGKFIFFCLKKFASDTFITIINYEN